MKTLLTFRNILLVFTLAALVNACQKDVIVDQMPDQNVAADESWSSTPQYIPGKYIVVLQDEAIPSSNFSESMDYKARGEVVRQAAKQILMENAIEAPEFDFVYGDAILGFAGSLTEADVVKLNSDLRVKYIEQDQVVALGPKGGKPNPPAPPAQTIPWGIARVGGPGTNYTSTINRAWIIDTGIDQDHPDLNVDQSKTVTFVNNSTGDDQNGHGTHVAGTIAAKNNSIGVVGVAPGALVVAVQVLSKNGMGSWSGIIAGVNYVAANAVSGDVANMSLGGGFSQAVNDAVQNASNQTNKHIYFSIAAGNESDNALYYSPASAVGNYIYTVSAMNSSDVWAYFSNYGPPVDICAPGVGIQSTWKNGGYNTISGTSMAAPHVAGILLSNNGNLNTDGKVTGDPDAIDDDIAKL